MEKKDRLLGDHILDESKIATQRATQILSFWRVHFEDGM